jgi:OHCU decarboxylase
MTAGFTISVNGGVERLNSLPADEAVEELLKCCGSTSWAAEVTAARPFIDSEHLSRTANDVWWSLGAEDWLESFRAHPRIGEKQAAGPQGVEARTWSRQEQAGVQSASESAVTALAEGNLEYERRFGFIFIVCAMGKSVEEMVTMLNSRLRNDAATELRIAAEEQRKITHLRLEKRLESLR